MKTKNLFFLKRSEGFSLTEMLTVVALSSLLVSLSFGVLLQLKKDSFALTNAVEKQQSKSEFQIFLNVTFSKVPHSFNLVNQLDDHNKNFFDYTWDSPLFSMTDESAQREVVFSPTNLRELYFIETVDLVNSIATYDPIYAYKITKFPGSAYESAEFTYQGMNSKISGSSDRVLSKLPAWKKGQLFLLQSPIPIRRLGPTEVLSNPSVPPRMVSFIGVVNSDETDLVPLADVNNVIFTKHPARDPAAADSTIATVDDFFRSLPTSGGAAPIVTLTPIHIIKLSSQFDSEEQNSIKLEKTFYSGKVVGSGSSELVEGKKVLVKNMVKWISLKRKSTNIPLIEVAFEDK